MTGVGRFGLTVYFFDKKKTVRCGHRWALLPENPVRCGARCGYPQKKTGPVRSPVAPPEMQDLLHNFSEVYYESIKREPKVRGINKCRCDERLQTKTKEFTRLPYTGLVLELEHLKIETRLISERFANAMGECENQRR